MNVYQAHSLWLLNNTTKEQFLVYDFSCFLLQDFYTENTERAGMVLEFKTRNRLQGTYGGFEMGTPHNGYIISYKNKANKDKTLQN